MFTVYCSMCFCVDAHPLSRSHARRRHDHANRTSSRDHFCRRTVTVRPLAYRHEASHTPATPTHWWAEGTALLAWAGRWLLQTRLVAVWHVLWPSRQRRRSVLMLRQCFVSTRRQARSTAVSRHPSTTTSPWYDGECREMKRYTAARASLRENSCRLWLQGVEDTTQQPAVILSDGV